MDSCIQALGDNWQGLHAVAYYSHLVPVVIGLFLGFYALYKTKGSGLAVLFFGFTATVALWLVGDLVDWVASDYFWVYYTWSWLDFVNVVFFVFGAYFFSLLARGRVTLGEKVLYILLCMPAFVIVVAGTSVLEFTQPICEAVNSDLLTNYKLAAEGLVVLSMLASLGIAWRSANFHKRIQLVAVLAATLLFFMVFAGTEYISSITGIYEINLYSLFVLPIFLIIMVFAVTNLGLFNFRLLGTQILSYTLILLSGLQLLFVEDSAHASLNVVSLGISIFFGVLLLQNAQKEEKARDEIERLARELEETNERQETLIHFIGHEVKGFLTKAEASFAALCEGDFGELPEKARPFVREALRQTRDGASSVSDILKASNLKKGTTVYRKEPFDLKALMIEALDKGRSAAEGKGLTLTLHLNEAVQYPFTGDKQEFGDHVLRNLIDNAVAYTPSGAIDVTLEKKGEKYVISVKDTGVGIGLEDMSHLFTEGGHGKESQRVNVHSTGYGLFIAKNVVEAHGGTIRVESEGPHQGSTFIVELPA